MADQILRLDHFGIPQTKPFVHASRHNSSIAQKSTSSYPIGMPEALIVQISCLSTGSHVVHAQAVISTRCDNLIARIVKIKAQNRSTVWGVQSQIRKRSVSPSGIKNLVSLGRLSSHFLSLLIVVLLNQIILITKSFSFIKVDFSKMKMAQK